MSVSRRAGPTAARTVDVQESLVVVERRLAGRRELDVVGQKDRERRLRQGDDAVGVAVDDGDRTTPVALPADQPVAQAVLDVGLTGVPADEPLDGGLFRAFDVESVHEAAVDLFPGSGPRAAFEIARRLDGVNDGKAVDRREIEVALVLPGYGHDRAGAVGRDDVLGDVDRDALAVEGVDRKAPRRRAALLRRVVGHALYVGLGRGGAPQFGDLFGVVARRELVDERVFRRESEEGRPEPGVGARREDLDCKLDMTLDREAQAGANGAADPVALHRLHLLGPVEPIERSE